MYLYTRARNIWLDNSPAAGRTGAGECGEETGGQAEPGCDKPAGPAGVPGRSGRLWRLVDGIDGSDRPVLV